MLRTLGAVLLLWGSISAFSQSRTIPEMMASVSHDLVTETGVQFGLMPTLDSVAEKADLVVRGRVGPPRSYLSEDERVVYSEYEVQVPRVLASLKSALPQHSITSEPIIVRQVGGTITLFGRRYTLRNVSAPPLSQDTEYLFLLKRSDRVFHAAGLYFGIFRVAEDRIIPVAAEGAFAPELQDLPAADAISRVVARARAAHR